MTLVSTYVVVTAGCQSLSRSFEANRVESFRSVLWGDGVRGGLGGEKRFLIHCKQTVFSLALNVFKTLVHCCTHMRRRVAVGTGTSLGSPRAFYSRRDFMF